MKSFNEEVDITFNEDKHTYTYKRKRLTSATAIVSKYHNEFDAERIASAYAQKRDIEMEDVLALWDSGGKIASNFGKALHAVLEHYYTWDDRWDDCKAMPNHPFLQQLITELDNIRKDGNTRQEVLVSAVDKNICGLIDDLLIIDEEKKICRIRDYKITYNILEDKEKLYKPFDYLGSNKLAKNFLQASVYGYMLEMSGWTVQGIDIYNWTGKWKHFILEGNNLRKTILLVGTQV